MEVIYSPKALKDIKFQKDSGNKGIQNKISVLIEDIKKHPFNGIGKPELLKYKLAGCLVKKNQPRRPVTICY